MSRTDPGFVPVDRNGHAWWRLARNDKVDAWRALEKDSCLDICALIDLNWDIKECVLKTEPGDG